MHVLCCAHTRTARGWKVNLLRMPYSGSRILAISSAGGAATPITIDVPSAPPFKAVPTDTFAINPAGAIVGLYMNSSFNRHGYLAIPAK